MSGSSEGQARFYAANRKEWREWLEKNHATSRGVWLIYYKQNSGKPRVAYEDAVEEALCFGWIDSRASTIDEERSMQFFSPRRPRSPWSRPNKQRVERLTEQGLMAPAGIAAIDRAKQNGSWSSLDAVEDLIVPPDLKEALGANPAAMRNFQAFSNSARKQILWWIESAKRPETRARRIEQAVSSAEENKNPLNYTANMRSKE